MTKLTVILQIPRKNLQQWRSILAYKAFVVQLKYHNKHQQGLKTFHQLKDHQQCQL